MCSLCLAQKHPIYSLICEDSPEPQTVIFLDVALQTVVSLSSPCHGEKPQCRTLPVERKRQLYVEVKAEAQHRSRETRCQPLP